MNALRIHSFSQQDLQSFRINMLKEFTSADKGIRNSLTFARHRIHRVTPSKDARAQILVIGGSHLVSAIVKGHNGKIEIISSKRERLPLLKTGKILLELVYERLSDKIDRIGVNFAYPLRPIYRDEKLDGELLSGTKEHAFKGMIGKPIGHEIEKYIFQKSKRRINVSAANDTVCLILSGLDNRPVSLAGGVVGTGYNFGFFLDEQTVINLESGNFNNFQQTDTGRIIDRESNNPGTQLLEKEVSGAYLYHHYNIYAERAGLLKDKISSTIELDNIAGTTGKTAELAQAIIRRSASLVAAQIAAIYDFKGKQRLTVLIEGSLFWKGWRYRDITVDCLEKMGLTAEDIKITRIERSYISGAARLVL